MVVRPLINHNKLYILLDSESFDKLLNDNNKDAKYILDFLNPSLDYISKYFEFLRSPYDVKQEVLKNIPYFEFNELKGIYPNSDELFNMSALHVKQEDEKYPISSSIIGLKKQDIENVAKHIFQKDELTDKERKAVFLMGIQSYINGKENKMLITENKIILRNRITFEASTGRDINIFNLKEALTVLDSFLKYRNKYLAGIDLWDRYSYYKNFFILKVPSFPLNKNDQTYRSFLNRFTYILASLDEIWIQKFLGIDDNSIFTMIYNFNYFISLVTGIFDNLALLTNEKYRLIDNNNKQRISLNPSSRKDFMNSLKNKNKDLYEHIIMHDCFLKLIHEMRNIIVHREMFERASFNYAKNIGIIVIVINREMLDSVRSCTLKVDKKGTLNWWGVHETNYHPKVYFIDPSRFSVSSFQILTDFCNKYMELLGFSDYLAELEKNNPNDDFLKEIESFLGDSDKCNFFRSLI